MVVLESGFYNAVLNENGEPDRTYSAEDMGALIENIISYGIIKNYGYEFGVTIGSTGTGTYQILVGSGRAWFDKKWMLNPSECVVDEITKNDVCCLVSLVVDTRTESREVRLETFQSTSASTGPTVPSYDNVYYHHLAAVIIGSTGSISMYDMRCNPPVEWFVIGGKHFPGTPYATLSMGGDLMSIELNGDATKFLNGEGDWVTVESGGSISGNVGSGTKPVYVQNGEIKPSTSDVGSGIKPIYMVNGTLTASTSDVGNTNVPIYLYDGVLRATTSTIGSSIQPIYMSGGVLQAMPGPLSKLLGGTGSSSGIHFPSAIIASRNAWVEGVNLNNIGTYVGQYRPIQMYSPMGDNNYQSFSDGYNTYRATNATLEFSDLYGNGNYWTGRAIKLTGPINSMWSVTFNFMPTTTGDASSTSLKENTVIYGRIFRSTSSSRLSDFSPIVMDLSSDLSDMNALPGDASSRVVFADSGYVNAQTTMLYRKQSSSDEYLLPCIRNPASKQYSMAYNTPLYAYFEAHLVSPV